jgi:hypothetical protein
VILCECGRLGSAAIKGKERQKILKEDNSNESKKIINIVCQFLCNLGVASIGI